MQKREDCNLRLIEDRDFDTILRWRNSDRIRAVSLTDRKISEAEHRAWFKKNKLCHDLVTLVFELIDKPIGVVSFSRIDRANLECFWGFYIGEEDYTAGAGSVMGYLGLEYAFNELGMRVIKGEVFDFNGQSTVFHKKFGFVDKKEKLRKVLKSGSREDLHLLYLTVNKWRENKPEVERKIFTRS